LSNLSEEDARDFFNPNGDIREDDDSEPEASAIFDYGAIFDSPDFSSIVRGRRSAHAKQYESKVKSVLKSGTMGSLRNGNFADAAAILHYGPGFAAAAGDLAAADERAAKAIDLITSPESPYLAFAFVTLPFVAQLFRNHEDTLKQIPEARRMARRRRREEAATSTGPTGKNVTLSLPFGRKINFRVGFRFRPLSRIKTMFRVPTHDPAELTEKVFSDPQLLAALQKLGVNIKIV
jgi:hypothetical protein